MKIDVANNDKWNRLRARATDKRRWVGYLVPPAIAAIAVWNEQRLTELSRTHEATLPLAIMLLLAALLQQRLRQCLVVTLCYGVGFLAVRDSNRVLQIPLPQALNYDWVDALRPVCLWSVAALATIAGIGESVKPGTVWARRCYFAASALYFTGVGAINYASNHSWRGVVLCITGLTAVIGCLFAHRVVEEDTEVDDVPDSDEIAQRQREEAHRAALKTKEWRGNLLGIGDDRDGTAVGGSADVHGVL